METKAELTQVTYIVPDMGCDHCEDAVSQRLLAVAGVEAVVTEVDTHRVTVHGNGLDFMALRASMENAGYQAA